MILIAPYSALAAIQDWNRPAGMALFGQAHAEPSGVTNRRIAFAHPWTTAQRDWIATKIAGFSGYSLVAALPADWRYAAPVL